MNKVKRVEAKADLKHSLSTVQRLLIFLRAVTGGWTPGGRRLDHPPFTRGEIHLWNNMAQQRMMMIFQSLYFFLLCCFFLMVGSQTEDLSYLLTDDFNVSLSWVKEENCTYNIEIGGMSFSDQKSPWTIPHVMNGECPNATMEKVCKNTTKYTSKCQEPLVDKVDCYIYSSKQTFCSWRPLSNATDLHFYYRLKDQSGNRSIKDPPMPLHKCSSYNHTDKTRTVCTLQARMDHTIDIWFNATLNNKTVINTFFKDIRRNVRPAPLNWTAAITGDELGISWTPPDTVPAIQWKYTINYTVCDEERAPQTTYKESCVLRLSAANCWYCVKIKAEAEYAGGTPWSNEKCFSMVAVLLLILSCSSLSRLSHSQLFIMFLHVVMDRGPSPLVYAAIIIPLMLAGLAVVAIVCCKKNREYIFPKVPVPRDLLSDISNNNNKSTMCKLYVPAEEEDNCKITLVMDPQNNKLNH